MKLSSYEIIGLCGTIFILIAFLFNSEKKIRIFDGIGAILFIIYGCLIGSWSNVILNGVLVVIQAVKLIKLKK